jgi:hypothetical protein
MDPTDRHLDHAEAQSTLVFGSLHGEPPLVGHSLPQEAVEAVAGARRRPGRLRAGLEAPGTRSHEGPQPLGGGQPVQEIGGRTPQFDLVRREVEVHGAEA